MKKGICMGLALCILLPALCFAGCASDSGNTTGAEDVQSEQYEIKEESMKAINTILDAYFSYRESQFSTNSGEITFSAAPNVIENLKIRAKELSGWEQITGARFTDVTVQYEILNASEEIMNEISNVEVIAYEKSRVPYSYDSNEAKDVSGWGIKHWITLQGSAAEPYDYQIVTDFYDDPHLWIINKLLDQADEAQPVEES